MKRALKISPTAINDIQDAADYYQKQQRGLGKKFADKAYKTIKKINSAPTSASISHNDIRYKVMDTFPFIITYRFDDASLFILRVFNTHQNPEKI